MDGWNNGFRGEKVSFEILYADTHCPECRRTLYMELRSRGYSPMPILFSRFPRTKPSELGGNDVLVMDGSNDGFRGKNVI